jgi:putative transposase
MVASAIRSIFEQPDEHAASERLRRVADSLTARFPAVAQLLTEAEPDLLVHFTFPEAHRPRIRSTNPRNGSTRRSRWTAVVGIFPTRASLIRLVGMVLFEQDDEWQDGRRYFLPESMARIDATATPQEVSPALLMAS